VQGGVGWSRRSFSEGGTCLAEGEKDYSPLEGGWGVLARLVKGGKILSHNKLPTPLFPPLARQVSPLKGRIYLSFP